MGSFIYLDNSNLWIEGKKVSAVKKGMALDVYEATQTGTFDNSFRLDFGEVLKIANNEPIKKASFYGSKPPDNDSLWNAVKRLGFKLDIKDRVHNKEKGVDSALITDAMEDFYTIAKPKDVFIIIAGDGDFIPLVEKLKAKHEVFVLFWDHAAGNLKRKCTKFISLNSHLPQLKKS